MIGWCTDNDLSKKVLGAIPELELRYIHEFDDWADTIDEFGGRTVHILYGILRGCSRAAHIISAFCQDYCYIDNGYFDAHYIDSNKLKDMNGKFRVVRNGLHHAFDGGGVEEKPIKILILPPSPYSANFYDTTPEDWVCARIIELKANNQTFFIRDKNSTTPLDVDLANSDGVLSFNSMAVMRAIELGKSIKDTHGMFKRDGFHRYDFDEIKAFYEPKQFTLDEIREGKVQW